MHVILQLTLPLLKDRENLPAIQRHIANESSAIINLRRVSTKLYFNLIFTMPNIQ